jgi:phosphoribosylanthranilate isomerase
MMIVQIYGSTVPEDARMLAELGVDHIGVAMGVSEHSFDMVPVAQAKLIFEAIPNSTRVGLVISSNPDEIIEMVCITQPTILHLACKPDAMDNHAVTALRKKLPGLPIMRAIPVTGPEALDHAREFEETSDYFLLDSFNPIMDGGVGATGMTHDWTISRKIIEQSKIPVILAGGLSPENVAESIRAVRPWGVDSLTHTNDPLNLSRKDRKRVEAFIQAAKNVEI